MSKVKVTEEFPGTIDALSEDQRCVLQELQKHVIKIGLEWNTQYDDWFQLRFCRARKFKIAEVIKMFDDQQEFRKKYDLDNIFEDMPRQLNIRDECIDEFYMGQDKEGNLVFYQSLAKFTEKNLLKMTEDEYIRYSCFKIEFAMYVIYPCLCRKYNKRIDQITIIQDLKNASISEYLSSKVRVYMKHGFNVGSFYYPETLKKFFIINAPFQFNAMWKLIKLFIDKVTVRKISILGSSYQKELFEHIDKSQVSKCLGGTGVDFQNIDREWKEYELFCFEKKTFFHCPEARISDPWKASQTLIYDVKQLRSIAAQNLTLDTTCKTKQEDQSVFIFEDDDDVDEGIYDLKCQMLKVRSLDIKQEGYLMTIPDEELWWI